ncbi:MAG: hypothetical protein M1828_004958 [Chrysothrix sp. TS-e1954]|nr:MAG: hypothetical protein M1828_004958 [Chrysothrix sp. TS-e1954]
MGESRQELLAWLNSLLQLNVTKVEQCGTGAALCQIFDSIFLDIPMSKVKFNVNTEYAYLNNFKVLQTIGAPELIPTLTLHSPHQPLSEISSHELTDPSSDCFTKHTVNRPIPVESLVKCKMQDNLEFLQWTKKYWDQYYPGIEYDPVARRKAAGTSSAAAPSSLRTSGAGVAPARTAMPPKRTPATSNTAATRAPRTGSAAAGGAGASSAALNAARIETEALKETVTGLERERDFYFNKLRDIEVMLQQEVEARPELEQEEGGMVSRLQAVLYETEEGFEIPEEGVEVGGNGEVEEETF